MHTKHWWKMGKVYVVTRLLLLLVILACGAHGGSTVDLTAILPIANDINAPLTTEQLVIAIQLGITDANQQQIINPTFGVTLAVNFR